MSVKPESREAFLEALRADQQGALADEPLAVCCLFQPPHPHPHPNPNPNPNPDPDPNQVSYLFGEDTETPNVFHMFEAYSGGREGFAAHAKTAHYAKWAEFKATDPFSAPAKVGYYEVYLPDSMAP